MHEGCHAGAAYHRATVFDKPSLMMIRSHALFPETLTVCQAPCTREPHPHRGSATAKEGSPFLRGDPHYTVEWGPREPHSTVRMGTRDPQSQGIPKML